MLGSEGIFISEVISGINQGPESLEQLRLLTEVMHLVEHMEADGSVPESVLVDVETNLSTAVQEIAMPSAVTQTVHRVEYEQDTEGRRRRLIKWLGKSAIQVAESGRRHHFSKAAFERVDVEVAEAVYAEENLQTGLAQAFISPKMSRFDAVESVAKEEHLYNDDSIRTSRAITDSSGEIIARQLESLLVTDIPLEAWVDMLQDPSNIFGKSISVRDARSALSVMEVFQELDAPEAKLPEGPVSIVAAVLPYIKDTAARASVMKQIEKFRGDQQFYRTQAERSAREWLKFDLELARSLKQGTATLAIESYIAQLQHQWGEEDLAVINSHDVAGDYIMTFELAATLEKAQRNILNSEAAILTRNEKVLKQVDKRTAEKLSADLARASELRLTHPGSAELARLEAQNRRSIARQNFKVGGGCPGDVDGRFRTGDGPDGEADQSDSEDKEAWTWKKGVCRVPECASPQPTEVGPCDVCRNCQHMYDRGLDPAKVGHVIARAVKSAIQQPDWVVSWFKGRKKDKRVSSDLASPSSHGKALVASTH